MLFDFGAPTAPSAYADFKAVVDALGSPTVISYETTGAFIVTAVTRSPDVGVRIQLPSKPASFDADYSRATTVTNNFSVNG